MIPLCILYWIYRWEKYQSEEEAALGRGKRVRKAISYKEAYAPQPTETLNQVTLGFKIICLYIYFLYMDLVLLT